MTEKASQGMCPC